MTDLPKLAAPARRALASAKIAKLEDLARHAEAKVMELHGMGPNAMAALKAEMKKHGLSFRAGK
jgi:hypothetical protein